MPEPGGGTFLPLGTLSETQILDTSQDNKDINVAQLGIGRRAFCFIKYQDEEVLIASTCRVGEVRSSADRMQITYSDDLHTVFRSERKRVHTCFPPYLFASTMQSVRDAAAFSGEFRTRGREGNAEPAHR